MRRLRSSEALRNLVAETSLSPNDLIHPIFAIFGRGVRDEVPSMPGVFRLSIDNLAQEVEEVRSLGIKAVILFGIPEHKDDSASGAYDPDGVVQQAVREIKRLGTDTLVITDCCLDEYTDHGHCGVVRDGEILNDLTLEILAKIAISQAEAGADIVAPSDMMDG